MKIIDLAALRSVLNAQVIIEAVRAAMIGHYHQRYVMGMPGQMLFAEPPGDCHIKYGYAKDGANFVIKVATGFYANATSGLPVNSGMVMVLSRQTGVPQFALLDEGWLTSWRTAAAGALAASIVAARKPAILGVLGAGHHAQLQALWIAQHLGIQQVLIWARSGAQAQKVAVSLAQQGLTARACSTTEEVLQQARLVVTATPSNQALFPADEVMPGTHIIAMGADTHGKQELDPALFAKAALIVTDDHHQCLNHGDFSHAVRHGAVPDDADRSFGHVLEFPAAFALSRNDISIVDLTGIAAQDIEIATAMGRRLGLIHANR